MTQDEQYLNLLSIFHYVVAGLTALFSCFFLIHIAIGIAMLCGAFEGKDSPPRFIGLFFIIFPTLFIMAAWILAGFMIAAGRKLRQRKSRTFCLVVAGIECISMPFGTILGVFTIVLLMKDSVKAIFEAQKSFQQPR
jgi:uncharacterized Tic20 family protein